MISAVEFVVKWDDMSLLTSTRAVHAQQSENTNTPEPHPQAEVPERRGRVPQRRPVRAAQQLRERSDAHDAARSRGAPFVPAGGTL